MDPLVKAPWRVPFAVCSGQALEERSGTGVSPRRSLGNHMSPSDIRPYRPVVIRPRWISPSWILEAIGVSIEQPALVVWGERDPFLEKRLADDFDRYVPSLEKRFLPHAGHWVQQEEPEAVNDALLHFLSEPPAEIPPTRTQRSR